MAFQKLAGLLPEEFTYSPDARAGLERIAGAYDYPRNRIVLISGVIGSRLELEYTLAHELTHALENQNFALRLDSLAQPGEPSATRRALIEGTATLTQYLYGHRYLGDRIPVTDRISGLASLIAGGVPYAIRAEAVFDYVYGGRFVERLRHRGEGWSLVNRALRHPPAASRDVLHPHDWPGARTAARVHLGIARTLGSEWRLIGAGEAGERDALAVLLAGIPIEARAGSSGWAGGRLEVWSRRGTEGSCEGACASGKIGVIGFRWSHRGDADQFAIAVPAYTVIALLAERLDDRSWRLPDGGYVSLGSARFGSALAFAPRAPLAARLARHAAVNAQAQASSRSRLENTHKGI